MNSLVDSARALSPRVPYRHGEEGGALLEAAFSMTILLTIVFGLIQVSLALYTFHFISYGAREGTRYAMVRGSGCSSPMTGCNATSAEIQTYVQGLGFPGINSSYMTVTTTWPDGNNNSGSRVQVNVRYAFPFTAPFLTITTVNMTSTSVMVISK